MAVSPAGDPSSLAENNVTWLTEITIGLAYKTQGQKAEEEI